MPDPSFRTLAIAVLAACGGGQAGAAPPSIQATARLAHCAAGTCLRVSGRRPDPAASVAVAGHPVAVAGGRRWRIDLPVADVRAWSPPFARAIAVRVADGAEERAALPVGLLGQATVLAFLDVRATP